MIENASKQFQDVPSSKLLQLAQVTSKRAMKAAARVASSAEKDAKDAEIDARAKESRKQQMELALAEPADVGRYKRKRGGGRKARTNNKRDYRRPSASMVQLEDDSATEVIEDENMQVEDLNEGPGPVLIDVHVEWEVEKITAVKQFKVKTSAGGYEWVSKYKVQWVGGEVTWETLAAVQDCEALDAFERKASAKRAKCKAGD